MPRVARPTYPITNTQPSGSLRIFGFINLKVRSMSGAFSSLTHLCRLRVVKTMSLSSQPLSATSVSNRGLFRSRAQASTISSSWSLSLLECQLDSPITAIRRITHAQ